MPVADLINLDDYRPRGAGCCAESPLGTDMKIALADSGLPDRPETDFPVGSVALLATPFPVDRGIWAEPRLVERFVKRSNGRWVSDPGADVSFPTLRALALAAPVVSVDVPVAPTEVLAGPGAPAEPEVYYMATAQTQPAPEWRRWAVLAGIIAVLGLISWPDRRRR
jgi:hypothetical protein